MRKSRIIGERTRVACRNLLADQEAAEVIETILESYKEWWKNKK